MANGLVTSNAPIVDANNIASINVNLVASSDINALEFDNVDQIAIVNGVGGTTLGVAAFDLGTTLAVNKNRAFDVTVTSFDASLSGKADTASLAVSGAGTKDGDAKFDVSTGNLIEAVTIATSGINFVSIAAGTGAKSITVTGAGTNTSKLVSAAAADLTVNLSAATGTNSFDVATFLNSTTTAIGGTGADTLKVNLNSATQVIPTVSGFETLTLDFDAAATYNASKTTGVANLNINGSTANAVVTQLAATTNILGTTSTNTGSVTVQYGINAKADVTYNIGSTASSATAVSNNGTTFSNIANLTVNAAGSGTSALGNLNVGSAATTLVLNTAAAANDLTVGSLTGAALTSVTANATAGDITLAGSDITMSKLESISLNATNKAGLSFFSDKTLTAAALTTFEVNAGDSSSVVIGSVAGAKALETIALTAGNNSSLTSVGDKTGFVVHATDSALTSVAIDMGDNATVTLAANGIFIDGVTAKTVIDEVSIVIGGLAAASRIGDIEADSINGINLDLGASASAHTLTIDAFKADNIGDISALVGLNSTIAISDVLQLADATGGTVGNITASGAGSFSIKTLSGSSSDYTVGNVDFSKLTGTGTAEFTDSILTGITMTGGTGIDNFIGTGGDDVITGNDGNDNLSGLAGNDVINGGAGNDVIIGGAGNDTLTGGTGSDTFIFAAASGIDSIYLGASTATDGSADIVRWAFTTAASLNVSGTTKTIFGFDATDTLEFTSGLLTIAGGTAIATGARTAQTADATANFTALVTTAASNPFIEINQDLAAANQNATSVAALLTGTVADGMSLIFAIDDGTDSYLWSFVGTASGAAVINAAEVQLIGIVRGVTAFGAGDFSVISA